MWGVLGAGSVGLTLAARLARSGVPVLVVCRDREQAALLRSEGIALVNPVSGREIRAPVVATAELSAALGAIGTDPLLLCVRSGATERIARELARCGARMPVASVQNGIDNEATLARHLPRVLGVVFRPTCTRVGPARVHALEGGRVVIGDYPGGISESSKRVAEALRGAGFEVGLSCSIGEDKWLKLCVNLMSAPNALVRRSDHRDEAFVALKVRLLEEARRVLVRHGIVARSCDGRDRSLDEEIAYQRGALARGTSARDLPLYNHVWTALREGRELESDRFHRCILALAAAAGISTPANAVLLAALERAAREGLGPECYGAEELLEAVEAASRGGEVPAQRLSGGEERAHRLVRAPRARSRRRSRAGDPDPSRRS